MKITIIGKIHNLLKEHIELKLVEMYEYMPEHSKSSIRGNINRYLKSSKEKVFFRSAKGTYKIANIEDACDNSEVSTSSNLVSIERFKALRTIKSLNKTRYSILNMVAGLDNQISMFDIEGEINTFEYAAETDLVRPVSCISSFLAKPLFGFGNMLNKVMNMDAVKFLKSLPDKCVDLLVTDPPYSVISGGSSKKKGAPSGMLSKNDGKIFEFNDIKLEEWIPEVYRVMKDNTHGYIMTNLLNLEKLMKVCQEVGFKIHNLLVWKKNNATPNRWYMKNCEYTLFVRKGKAKPIEDKGSMTVHEFDNIIGNKLHPTEKPLELTNYYVKNSVVPNGILLDPFCGLGSSVVSAVLNGMNFLTTEIDKKYFNLSQKRIKNVFELGYDDRNLLFE